VVGAGLLVRTFVGLVRTNPGYAVDDRTLTFRVNLPTARYGDAGARASFVESLVHEIHAMPEVGAVGYTAVSPWNGGLMSVGFRVEGRPTGHGNAPSIQYATASDELFSSLAIPLRAGRFFTPADRVGTPQVLIISERVARRFWPNANPIGARVRLGTGGAGDNSDAFEVVGVVGDVRPSVMADPLATLYVSERQWVGRGGEFIVRSASDAAALIPGIKQILRALDPQLPLILPRTLQEVVAGSVARQRLAMTLMGAFAGLALLISALGVYSVMAYAVLGRTREFGIRSALGAGRASILLLVFRQGLGTTVAGIAAGVLIAALLSRWVASLLVGVSTHDALTFTVAPIVLLVVATMASMIPARAATRVQPVEALRSD
jgi:predicted permease